MATVCVSPETSASCTDCILAARGACPGASLFRGRQLRPKAVQNFAAETDILQAGRTSDTVSVLRSGWAYSYAALPSGERQIINFLIAGDVFDKDAITLCNAPMLFSTRALTDISVCNFAAQDFRDLLAGDVRSRHFAKQHVMRQQTLVAKHLIDVARRRAAGRLASFILEMRDRLAQNGLATDSEMPFPLKQEDIANAMGLTIEHVNRTLKMFRRDGLIEIGSGKLIILDHDQLCKASQT